MGDSCYHGTPYAEACEWCVGEEHENAIESLRTELAETKRLLAEAEALRFIYPVDYINEDDRTEARLRCVACGESAPPGFHISHDTGCDAKRELDRLARRAALGKGEG